MPTRRRMWLSQKGTTSRKPWTPPSQQVCGQTTSRQSAAAQDFQDQAGNRRQELTSGPHRQWRAQPGGLDGKMKRSKCFKTHSLLLPSPSLFNSHTGNDASSLQKNTLNQPVGQTGATGEQIPGVWRLRESGYLGRAAVAETVGGGGRQSGRQSTAQSGQGECLCQGVCPFLRPSCDQRTQFHSCSLSNRTSVSQL